MSTDPALSTDVPIILLSVSAGWSKTLSESGDPMLHVLAKLPFPAAAVRSKTLRE